MNNVGDLELNVMSCLLIKPELMNEVILEDKHFGKYQRLWTFMKSFYKKFNTFDVQLMYSVCKDKWHIVNYMAWLSELEPTAYNFQLYQKQIIEQYEQKEKEKVMKELIFKYANDLFVGNLKLEDFFQKTEEIKNEYMGKNEK